MEEVVFGRKSRRNRFAKEVQNTPKSFWKEGLQLLMFPRNSDFVCSFVRVEKAVATAGLGNVILCTWWLPGN